MCPEDGNFKAEKYKIEIEVNILNTTPFPHWSCRYEPIIIDIKKYKYLKISVWYDYATHKP